MSPRLMSVPTGPLATSISLFISLLWPTQRKIQRLASRDMDVAEQTHQTGAHSEALDETRHYLIWLAFFAMMIPIFLLEQSGFCRVLMFSSR